MSQKTLIIVDSYYGESHKVWGEALRNHPSYHVYIYGLTPRNWKWQMEAGAIDLADSINKNHSSADIIMATDMVNLALLKSLLDFQADKYWLYMHENQITYPRSTRDADVGTKRDQRYGWINFSSCLVADRIIFNSQFHRNDFLKALPRFLKQFPKNNLFSEIEKNKNKSEVISLSINFTETENHNSVNHVPHILWSHRWEHDKNPKEFLEAMVKLSQENIQFKLILLGKGLDKIDEEQQQQIKILERHIYHKGFESNHVAYKSLIEKADIFVSTAYHEFFGVSALEAISLGCFPLLPNRLAYPELLHEKYKEACLYDGQFYDAMKDCILSNQWQTHLSDQYGFMQTKYAKDQTLKLY